MERFDAAVIGGGLLGCFAARELCRWKLNTVILEAREDICTGISRANTAVVYPGYDQKPGTMKAKMTVRANAAFDRLCAELDVPFSRCGSMMLSYGEKADAILRRKFHQGKENRISEMVLLDSAAAYDREPGLAPGLCSALWAPAAGTVNPWQLGIAACENAVQNGAKLRLNTELLAMRKENGGYILETNRGDCFTRAVVNCSGLAADRVQEMLYPSSVRIVPTAGDYLVLDRNAAAKPTHILEYEPEERRKGLTVVPTVEGSLLIGPTERDSGTAYATTGSGLRELHELAKQLLPELNPDDTIRSFAALRPNPQRQDGSSIHSFVIEHPDRGFWSLIGIKTPGMTCAGELGCFVAERLAEELNPEKNPNFDPVRNGILKAHDQPVPKRKSLVEENPDYGEIICFCEDVTKAEVLEAIRRGAVTVDGIKRRVGSGMGRCQGARCQSRIAACLSEELNIPESAVLKDGAGSELMREFHDFL